MTIEERAQTVIAEIGRYSESSEIRALIEKALSDQADELEAARKVADAAVAEQITGHAWERVRRISPQDHDATTELGWANEHMLLVLDAAVREYRKLMEGENDGRRD